MISKCLFPAAGYGTRFLPATKSIPKEMLPIVNKPLIQYGVEEALQAGMHDIAIVTGKGKHAIEPAHRGLHILLYPPETDACIGDNEEDGVLRQMAEVYAKYRCSIVAIEEVDPSQTHKYGVIAGIEVEPGLYHVKEMVEKPAPEEAPSNLAIIGRYILTPDIFDWLRRTEPGKGGEIQITDALEQQAKNGRVLAYRFRGRRFDCGSVHGFVAATNHFYEKCFGPAD